MNDNNNEYEDVLAKFEAGEDFRLDVSPTKYLLVDRLEEMARQYGFEMTRMVSEDKLLFERRQ